MHSETVKFPPCIYNFNLKYQNIQTNNLFLFLVSFNDIIPSAWII
jgi:hypothetical protein